MIIKNNDSQVFISGTWKHEISNNSELSIKINDIIVYSKTINSNEVIDLEFDLLDKNNIVEIVEIYNNVEVKKITQNVIKKENSTNKVGETILTNSKTKINLTQEIYNSKQVKINFKELYKNYNIEKIQATVDQKDFNDLIVVANGDISFNFDYQINTPTFINIEIDVIPNQEKYLVNELNIKVDDIEIVKQIELNNETGETTADTPKEQLANEITQTSIKAPTFEKTGTHDAIYVFGGVILTCLFSLLIVLRNGKDNA